MGFRPGAVSSSASVGLALVRWMRQLWKDSSAHGGGTITPACLVGRVPRARVRSTAWKPFSKADRFPLGTWTGSFSLWCTRSFLLVCFQFMGVTLGRAGRAELCSPPGETGRFILWREHFDQFYVLKSVFCLFVFFPV